MAHTRKPESRTEEGFAHPEDVASSEKTEWSHAEDIFRGAIDLLFIDADRNPIKGLKVVLTYSGKTVSKTTPANGLIEKINLEQAGVELIVGVTRQRDGTAKEIRRITSGYLPKLVTIQSKKLKIDSKTAPHPKDEEAPQPKIPPQARNTDEKKSEGTIQSAWEWIEEVLGIRGKAEPFPNGVPRTKISGDEAELDFLDEYKDRPIQERDYEDAAMEIKCEAGMIYAIAKQESGSAPFINLWGRKLPNIRFERHLFRKITGEGNSPYLKTNPDICGAPYIKAKKDKKTGKYIRGDENHVGELIALEDVQGIEGDFQYKRFAKAYALDKNAAIQATSWGKFQILGMNYKIAGFNSPIAFAKAMCRSELEHLMIFIGFANKNLVLRRGLQTKNYEEVARGHNGEKWRKFNPKYAANIEANYKEYVAKKTEA